MARVTGSLKRRASSSPGADTMRRNYPLLLKRMERLMEVSRNLASTLELDKLLRMIIQAAQELTDTEVASIMLFDPHSGELRFEAATNMEPTLQGIVIPVEGSIAGWIVTQAEPLVVPDTSKDPRWHQKVDEATDFVTRSILGVPLVTREKTLGALEAINKRTGEFTEEDADTLQTLAAQAAVAIVNARLFQQSDLISEMVHELRTPLMSLTATSHLLLRPELPADKRVEMVKTLQRETGRLAQMTTDFLDMARLESGRMRFTREKFSLPELIAECVEVVRPQAGTRRLSLSTETEPGLPEVESDRGKLKQVLLNLLTNAVKYNRENGSITVSARMVDTGCRVSVADTGRGIPPEAMTHMFEKFYRVPDSENTAPGTGLGLPIAKKIVEALGGEMWVESTAGVGSTFYFTLPSAHNGK
ncbi:MAG: ATP-binding protein [Anaerolineales bacterium]